MDLLIFNCISKHQTSLVAPSVFIQTKWKLNRVLVLYLLHKQIKHQLKVSTNGATARWVFSWTHQSRPAKKKKLLEEKKTPEHFLKHDTISYLCLLSWSLTGAMRNFCNLSCLLLINPKVSKKKESETALFVWHE